MRHAICFALLISLLMAVAVTAAPPAPEKLDQYLLGPGDEVSVRVRDLEDFNNFSSRIETDGTILLPIVGSLPASGLSIGQLQKEVAAKLACCLVSPVVTVGIKEYRSQPITILGAVNKPGVHQLQGRLTLVEVLSLAEGLNQDAGNVIRITRRASQGHLPLFGAKLDETASFYTAEVRVKSLLEGRNPHENIAIRPHDLISVPKADLVYVLGSVTKPGGFVLNDNESLSVLHALTLAGGMTGTAASGKARILRASAEDSSLTHVPVNLGHVLSGKSENIALRPNDILYVPSSLMKAVSARSIEAAVQMATGIVIWRR
jgi:polysaccharide export outer membrane protein